MNANQGISIKPAGCRIKTLSLLCVRCKRDINIDALMRLMQRTACVIQIKQMTEDIIKYKAEHNINKSPQWIKRQVAKLVAVLESGEHKGDVVAAGYIANELRKIVREEEIIINKKYKQTTDKILN